MTSDGTERRSHGSFRRDIEGLRGVAVLLVVACHCGISWCAGGFVGVDVFFVLSGYLITGLLAAEYRAESRIDLPRFYARRVRRLLPAGALVLLVTALSALAIDAPQELATAGRAACAAGLYLSNVFFDHGAADYFAPDVGANPVLHTWTLGVEEQFYLIWPLLILVVGRGLHATRRSIGILGAITALSFACCLYATRHAPTFAFYELPARAWEFAAGGLLALVPAPRGAALRGLAAAAGFAGIALIVATGVLLPGGAGFPGWIALLPVAGTLAALFAGAAAPGRGIGVVLASAPLQFVGARSYSWYLWHWPFIVFSGALFPGVGVGGKVVAAVASLAAATLTFTLVERPIRQSAYLIARPGLSLGLAAAVTLLTVGASSAIVLHAEDLGMSRELQLLSAATTDVADLSQAQCVSQGPSPEVKTCTFGVGGAAQSVALFGDSHAIQWFNPLRTAALAEGWRLVTVLKAGCAASDINPHPMSAGTDACTAWRSRAIDEIARIRPTAIVMASYTGVTLRGFRAEAPISNEDLRAGTRRTLERLAQTGIPVVLLRDSPLPPFDVAACVGRQVVHQLDVAANCAFDATVAVNDGAFAAERAAAVGLPGISFLDLSDLICPGRSCPPMQHGVLVYRDDNHLTGTFAETLAPAMRARLFGLLRSGP